MPRVSKFKSLCCGAGGCDQPARGIAIDTPMCGKHRQRWVRLGATDLPVRNPATADGKCIIEGCERPIWWRKKHHCAMHATRLKRGSRLGLALPRKQCLQCGVHLVRNQSRYCSYRCSMRHWNGVPEFRDCVACGQRFPLRGRPLVCSAVCEHRRFIKERRERQAREMATLEGRAKFHAREHVRRARKRGVGSEKFSPIEIFERDGWRCQLCFGMTNRNVRWPHTDMPSLDHIIPLAAGGAHARINSQCTHLGCNTRKNKRPLGQLRLFA